jgi:hypothetical protein
MRSTKTEVRIHNGWSCMRDCSRSRLCGKSNGELLTAAEPLFDVLSTIDKNIPHQQNLKGRNIAILVLCARSNDISDLSPLVPNVLAALKTIISGQIIEITLQ